MFAFGLALFSLVLLGFSGAVVTVAFHLSRYSVPGDRTALVRNIFLAGSAIFFFAAVTAFTMVPWNELDSLR
ncbi:MAG: hypothetical protein A2991_02420 [Candidatus Terrybacteria bacterium RIFCSPLOWO2_01_FULL_58_14]|uniref:Cytochrome C biogenesis protein transmembrane domain-containing protein n=2 Tax=Candidatus Terryibacteriota TaxID=1817920 RepID=A0A1G2Q0B8_9BACT|nr:MAG: hypothetical protein A2682_03610 [Candidatus Terrybacteria bacterium RIFCSPHIGHO2_01_FULL_58_15]OHA54018.1 MAG: hypothetical protein A2991_02420 [Candidatus Terrybacteria bacterium RIFCSPLOWO2_01_FULL_58_14]